VLAGSLVPHAAARQPAPDAGARTAGRLFPRYEGAVPVLLYHRILPADGRGVAAETFAAQVRRLHDLGFAAITLDRYVRFARGDAVELPRRPILLTFDDGSTSALDRADPVLARYGWSAVAYVPTGAVGLPGRLSWEELRRMRASGRWEIDEHAGDGHVLVTVDAAGRREPFYANEVWAGGAQESFAHYKSRASGDIEAGSAALARNLPGWAAPGTFAVPFGDYGQRGSNDPRIEPWLSGYLEKEFAVVFVQRDDRFTTPGEGFANRLTVASGWDADALEAHLLRGLDRLERRAGR
jgi:poly-beta-1,6-N-acetyl-D-glucosamine N-deacetylase